MTSLPMTYDNHTSSRVVVGTGRYHSTPIGRVPYPYLFRQRTKTGLFRHEALKANRELAIRRKGLKISTRTLRSMEAIMYLQMVDNATAPEINDHIKGSLSGTKKMLTTLRQIGILGADRGVEGGYYLRPEKLPAFSIVDLDNYFAPPTPELSKINHVVQQKLDETIGRVTVGDILNEKERLV